jgi:predicted nucleic acid-binding protein
MADGRIYVDSCCFIDLAKESIGTLSENRTNHSWYVWKLLEANKDEELEIHTSTLTIAECTHADGNMEQRVKDLFTRLLMSGQYVRLVQPTPFVAADGRDLRWRHGILLNGADYVHVASALAVKATEFLTTDDRLLRQAAKIEALGMRIVMPALTALLPDRYRQGELLDDKIAILRGPSGSSPRRGQPA